MLVSIVISSCKKETKVDYTGQKGTITDVDGNIYPTIGIGTQIWMAENLKTTKLNDGTSIPLITDELPWRDLTTPGYCWYNNDFNSNNIYGALYNCNAINTGKLAPSGWHIPTHDEWEILINYLGGQSTTPNKLKELGITHWKYPNGGTNITGFTALPGGLRGLGGGFGYGFSSISYSGFWWSSTEFDTASNWSFGLASGDSGVNDSNISKKFGLSVRCLKN